MPYDHKEIVEGKTHKSTHVWTHRTAKKVETFLIFVYKKNVDFYVRTPINNPITTSGKHSSHLIGRYDDNAMLFFYYAQAQNSKFG